MRLIVSYSGRELEIRQTLVQFQSFDYFLDCVSLATGIPYDSIICITQDGVQVNEAVMDALRAQGPNPGLVFYVFDRELLYADVEVVAPQLEEAVSHRTLAAAPQLSTPLAPDALAPLLAWAEDAEQGMELDCKLAKEFHACIHRIEQSTRVGIANLQAHADAIKKAMHTLEQIASTECAHMQHLLARYETDIYILQHIHINPKLVPRTEKGQATLGAYVDVDAVCTAAKECKEHFDSLQTQYNNAYQTELQYGEDLRDIIAEMQLLDLSPSQNTLHELQKAIERGKAALATLRASSANVEALNMASATLHTCCTTVVACMNRLVDDRNEIMLSQLNFVQDISSLESDYASLGVTLSEVDAAFSNVHKGAFKHLTRVKKILWAYGASLIEARRRSEYSKQFMHKVQQLAELMAEYAAEEKAHRNDYLELVAPHLPWYAAMDGTSLAMDISVKRGANHTAPEFGAADVDEFLHALDALHSDTSARHDSIDPIGEVRADLSARLHALDDEEARFVVLARRQLCLDADDASDTSFGSTDQRDALIHTGGREVDTLRHRLALSHERSQKLEAELARRVSNASTEHQALQHALEQARTALAALQAPRAALHEHLLQLAAHVAAFSTHKTHAEQDARALLGFIAECLTALGHPHRGWCHEQKQTLGTTLAALRTCDTVPLPRALHTQLDAVCHAADRWQLASGTEDANTVPSFSPCATSPVLFQRIHNEDGARTGAWMGVVRDIYVATSAPVDDTAYFVAHCTQCAECVAEENNMFQLPPRTLYHLVHLDAVPARNSSRKSAAASLALLAGHTTLLRLGINFGTLSDAGAPRMKASPPKSNRRHARLSQERRPSHGPDKTQPCSRLPCAPLRENRAVTNKRVASASLSDERKSSASTDSPAGSEVQAAHVMLRADTPSDAATPQRFDMDDADMGVAKSSTPITIEHVQRSIPFYPVSSWSDDDNTSADGSDNESVTTPIPGIDTLPAKPGAIPVFPAERDERVGIEVYLEESLAVEGGCLQGCLRLQLPSHTNPKTAMLLAQPRVRLIGYEALPKDDMRHVFYHHTSVIDGDRSVDGPSEPYVLHGSPAVSEGANNALSSCYASLPDADGFYLGMEGVHILPFSLQLPFGRGVKGSYLSKKAEVGYILIASVRVKAFGEQHGGGVAHCFQKVTLYPYLNPAATLASALRPLVEHGGATDGKGAPLRIAAALHRETWVAGQRVYFDMSVLNHTKDTIHLLHITLQRTEILYKIGDENSEPITESSTEIVAQDTLNAHTKNPDDSWWAGVKPGPPVHFSHSFVLPDHVLTIPHSRHVEVQYSLRIGIGNDKKDWTHLSLPLRIVNFVSLDPPPPKRSFGGAGLLSQALGLEMDQHLMIERVRTMESMRSPRAFMSASGHLLPSPVPPVPLRGKGDDARAARTAQHRRSLDFINSAIRSATARRASPYVQGNDAVSPAGLGIELTAPTQPRTSWYQRQDTSFEFEEHGQTTPQPDASVQLGDETTDDVDLVFTPRIAEAKRTPALPDTTTDDDSAMCNDILDAYGELHADDSARYDTSLAAPAPRPLPRTPEPERRGTEVHMPRSAPKELARMQHHLVGSPSRSGAPTFRPLPETPAQLPVPHGRTRLTQSLAASAAPLHALAFAPPEARNVPPPRNMATAQAGPRHA
ncbi:hypothetical protein MVES1_002232 [Malassezia vespertilionis]|uniref:Autophagy-related protein 11 n=1 Tax=Malassezia vespertilionis TaxID=2020962 RepID=A0A2N1JC29_9BASI|nr:uncharacterized protein MVES1_002232 [Malassezia vespertilionis]PKI84093.1 hypothetical protein MVES_002106 [Malassezia vespertilionis]WFD06877.1 hypothetical protein MVES1_002232 [Malassezia vespertilionis]